MTILRVFASFCLLGLLSASNLLADTIRIKVTRELQLMGFSAKMHVYVNGKALGTISNGQVVTFRCDNARIGINEASITVVYFTREAPLLVAGNRNRRFFVVKHPGEEIAIDLGYALSGFGLFKVSTEVDSGVERIELNRTLKGIVIKETPPFRVAPGSDQVYEETMTVRREIKTSTNWKVEADLRAEVDAIWASITLNIKGKLERTTYEDNSVEIKRTRRLTIRPSRSAVKLVWVEYFRTGTAVVVVNGGREVRIPFEVAEDLILRAEAVQ